MAFTRKRPEDSFEQTQGQLGPRVETISALHGGYNGYTDPTLLSPQFWAASSNVYSGQFGTLRRARFANVVSTATSGYSAQSARFSSLYGFRDPTPQNLLLGDVNNKLWTFNTASSYGATQRLNPYVDPTGTGSSKMGGPWMRASLVNFCFEVNGQVKQKGRGALLTTIEGFGIDAPDASPAVTLSGGSITTTVGRKYQYAWENVNTSHVGPPSPSTNGIIYTNQNGTIDLVEAGTVAVSSGGNTVTGTSTSFSQGWVGRSIWIQGDGGTFAQRRITAVTSTTSLTVNSNYGANLSGKSFVIVDPQCTHVRLYCTSDGGAVFFDVARNIISFTSTTLAAAGFEFVDSQTEPNLTTFIAGNPDQVQLYNVPPPIGKFIHEYNSRLMIFGVTGIGQTFFYSNIEATTIGQAPESFAPLNQVTLPIGDANINGMGSLPTGLIIWSDKHDMFKLTGSLSDNTQSTGYQIGATLQRLPYQIGIASPYARITSNLGVFWLSSDREVWLYTDSYAPKNVGKPVQDILNSINPANLSDARMTLYKTEGKTWLALAVAVGSSTFNNRLLLLDLDLLASNGTPSFFTFDLATNAPSWWVYNVNCEAIESIIDTTTIQRLVASDTDLVTNVDYDGTSFSQGAELPVTGSTTLHAVGNDQPQSIKWSQWVRFHTNDQANIIADGWTFAIASIDDDVYTFAAPNTSTLTPGTDNPSTSLSLEYGPSMFRFGGVKYSVGRRFKFTINFPTATPSGPFWELKEIQFVYNAALLR